MRVSDGTAGLRVLDKKLVYIDMCVYKMSVEDRLKTLEKKILDALQAIMKLVSETKEMRQDLVNEKRERNIRINRQGEAISQNNVRIDDEMKELKERIAALEAKLEDKLKEKSFVGRMKERVLGVHSSSFQNKTVW